MPHILVPFEDALQQLTQKSHALAVEISANFARLKAVLDNRHAASCNQVIADEAELLDRGREIEFECAKVLALFHPLASDLRLVVSLQRCVERLGQAASETVSIAKKLRSLLGVESFDPSCLEEIFAMAQDELGKAIEAYHNADSQLALQVKEQDRQLDSRHRELMEQLIDKIPKAGHLSTSIELLFIIRSVERVGDHAKNIANNVIFLNENRDVRHQREA